MAEDHRDSTVESVIGRAKEAIDSATGTDGARDEGAQTEAGPAESGSGEKRRPARENTHEN